MTAAEPQVPTCSCCGSTAGPWRPTDERYPSGAQVLVCSTPCTPTEPLTDDQLAEYQALTNAATGGPWRVEPHGPLGTLTILGPACLTIGTLDFGSGPAADADLAFVLRAPEMVDVLLAEVERLRALLASPAPNPAIGEPMNAEQFFRAVQDGDLVTATTPRMHPVLHGYVHSLWPERTGCNLDQLANARTYGLSLDVNEQRGTVFTIHPRPAGGAQ